MLVLVQVQDQLNPAEEALDHVSELMKPTKPQLDELEDLLQRGGRLSRDALGDSSRAEDEAAAAEQVRTGPGPAGPPVQDLRNLNVLLCAGPDGSREGGATSERWSRSF